MHSSNPNILVTLMYEAFEQFRRKRPPNGLIMVLWHDEKYFFPCLQYQSQTKSTQVDGIKNRGCNFVSACACMVMNVQRNGLI